MSSSWTQWLPSIISAGTGVAGAIVGSRAAGSATDKQVAASEKAAELERQSTKEALDLQRGIYNRGVQMQYPTFQFSSKALDPLGKGMGFAAPEGGYKIPSLADVMLPETAGTAAGTGVAGSGGSLGISAGLAPSSTVKPTPTLQSLMGSGVGGASLGGLAGGALGSIGGAMLPGAGSAALFGAPAGPIGMAIGAAIGIGLSQIGKGRKEADKIVPYQNALTQGFDAAIKEIKAKDAAGTLTPADWREAIDHLTPLYNEYQALTQKFGRAGPGGRQSTAYMGDMLKGWEQYANPGVMPGRAQGGPVSKGQYIVGENGPEVLEMAPGAEGFVYPHSTFTSMMKRRMPGRATGGPVGGDPNDPNDPTLPAATMSAPQLADPALRAKVLGTQDPYANMQAPYDVTPGEFMQPWQGQLPDPSRSDRPLPNDPGVNQFNPNPVNKMPFSFNAQSMYNDPGYQFRLNEGVKARERMASAGGRVLGGRTLKDLTRYGEDYASGEYQNAYNRALGENQMAYGRNVDEYGRSLGENQMAYGRNVDQYGRQMDQNNTMYGRDTDAYNRLLAQYGIQYDTFKQNQADRYNRLMQTGGLQQ